MFREFFLLVRHGLWLNFHSETTAHSYVKTEFQRDYPSRLMIGRSTDMLCHSHRRIEIRGTPLHKYTLQRIGIITHPKLIESGHHSIINTTAAATTSLHHQIRIFGTNTFYRLLQSTMKINVYMRLLVLRQIRRSVIHQRRISIPFDIGDIRIVGH